MCKSMALAGLSLTSDGEFVSVTGALRHLQLKRTALGEDWATMVLAQDDETVTVLVFVRTFATVHKETLAPDELVRVTGRVHRSDDGILRITASSVVRQ